jgi:PBP1b-binding outer membrane lipoprotein LpoB
MKKIFTTLTIIILSLASCTSYKSAQVTDVTGQEKEVAAAVEQFRTSIINADRTLLESIFAA